MPEAPILNYHVRQRRPWLRVALLGLLIGLAVGGGYRGYTHWLGPRLREAQRRREMARRLDELLNHRIDRSSPVAAVALESAIASDPALLDRHGKLGYYIDGVDDAGSRTLCHWRLSAFWHDSIVHYDFQHGANVFVGKRSAGGRDFLVNLDVTTIGRLFRFYGVAIDLSAPDPAAKVFLQAHVPREVADVSFTEDAAYIMAGEPDANDPSAFSFVVFRGPYQDHVSGRVRGDGTIDLEVNADPAAEYRWHLHARP